MDSRTARQFRERWLAVAAIEDAEQQAMSLEERWQQLNRLLAMAIALQLDLSDREEDMVRERWIRLKAAA
jgi:hypothetical protein